ncbi:MAG: FAD-dependent oxidoreductase [Campylobacterota bacterium]|nr:FAD-dependent oxidoreductase [Campylobacterota bacterium]
MIYDYLIIGAGIAGLNAARMIPKDKKVLVICKQSPWECNTFWAQGGVVRARDEEDIPFHIQDTLNAGVSLNDTKAVELLSKHSIDAIDDLIDAGFMFDKNQKGELAFTKEAAHSTSRILHADGDATGRMMHMFLLQQCPHEVVTDSIVIDLLYENGICYGAHVLKKNKDKVYFAHNTIIASGGVGSIYRYHTNSTTIAGDIQGICVEKGISLKDMEMMQFHPTVFVDSPNARKQLLTEALRGEGATIEDEEGYAFLKDYHEDKELAPRDVVSRAIFDYAKKTGSKIYLSFKNFDKTFFKKRFPNIYKDLKEIGFDLPFERVPISPAFHYSMGGIDVDLNSKVKNSKNLYAIGEVACTGVHGANRLASNSLLEGLVFSKLAIEDSVKENYKIDATKCKNENDYPHFVLQKSTDKAIKNALRNLMWTNVGIVRKRQELIDALEEVESYLKEDVGRLLFLRLLTAKSIIKSAINRKKSIGAHYIKEK